MVCMQDKVKVVGHMSGDAGAFSDMRGDTLMTPDHTAVQVCSSGYSLAGIGRSSWKGLSTGCHVKAPVRCPCGRLATLNGAPRMRMWLS